MQQGSEVSTKPHHPPAERSCALIIQQHRIVALKEVKSLCSTMHNAALYCIDQNHVTMDHMEAMVDLLAMMSRQVEALHLDFASQ
jgi:hypothetical protein